MKTQTIILWIVILVIIDQSVKIIINTFFIDCNFDIIPHLLAFKPTFNQKYSYLNDSLYRRFNIDLGLTFHIILFLLGAIMIVVICDYCKNLKKSKLLDFSLICFMAGLLCSLSGIFIWDKGILDYIYLKPLFVFDMKDLYLNCFVFLFLLYVLKNKSTVNNTKMKDIVLHVKKRLKKS
jgi:hypothetical protein